MAEGRLLAGAAFFGAGDPFDAGTAVGSETASGAGIVFGSGTAFDAGGAVGVGFAYDSRVVVPFGAAFDSEVFFGAEADFAVGDRLEGAERSSGVPAVAVTSTEGAPPRTRSTEGR